MEVSTIKRTTDMTFRPRRQSSRAHFYDLLLGIVDTLQESTKNDIRQARERELQRRSIGQTIIKIK